MFKTDISRSKLTVRAVFGSLFSPLDALWGLMRGGYYFMRNPRNYFWGYYGETGLEERKIRDHKGRGLSGMFAGARVFTVAMTVLCVLAVVGSLAVPIPGITPLVSVAAVGVLKAIGVTTAWSTAARFVGAALGAVADFFKLRQLFKKTKQQVREMQPINKPVVTAIEEKLSTTRIISNLASTALAVGFFGEAGVRVGMELQAKKEEKPSVNEDDNDLAIPLISRHNNDDVAGNEFVYDSHNNDRASHNGSNNDRIDVIPSREMTPSYHGPVRLSQQSEESSSSRTLSF